MEKKAHEEIRENIAFLDVKAFDDKHELRGGILVTDINTYPIEFRVTGPIRPTALQKILYGNVLESYIYVELITLPLFKTINNQPLFAFTLSSHILEARSNLQLPIFQISQSNGFELKTHPKYEQELRVAKTVLSKLNKNMLLEPFSRIQAALSEAHKQKIGEKFQHKRDEKETKRSQKDKVKKLEEEKKEKIQEENMEGNEKGRNRKEMNTKGTENIYGRSKSQKLEQWQERAYHRKRSA